MERIKTYYQPEYKGKEDALPKGLASFVAFKSQEDCKIWLKNNGFNPEDFEILEYHDQDIEDATIIDGDGDLVQFTGFVEQDTIEAGLIQADTLDEFEELLDVYGEKSLDEEEIDDGCGDGKDNYVMMRCYSLSVKDYKMPFTVYVYYGDVTREVGHVEISDNEKILTENDYKNMPTSDLFQAVCEECSKDTILEQAEAYIGEDRIREFLFACLGVNIE